MMLQLLLDTLSSGSALDTHTLAKKLDVTEKQVLMMLEDLERVGKVTKVELCDTTGCENCSVTALCHTSTYRPVLWTVSRASALSQARN